MTASSRITSNDQSQLPSSPPREMQKSVKFRLDSKSKTGMLQERRRRQEISGEN